MKNIGGDSHGEITPECFFFLPPEPAPKGTQRHAPQALKRITLESQASQAFQKGQAIAGKALLILTKKCRAGQPPQSLIPRKASFCCVCLPGDFSVLVPTAVPDSARAWKSPPLPCWGGRQENIHAVSPEFPATPTAEQKDQDPGCRCRQPRTSCNTHVLPFPPQALVLQ